MQDDRRKHKRLFVRLPVHFKVKTTNKFGNTLSCDVSGGGLRLLLENFVAPNTDFMIEFTLADLLQIITAVGRVVWTKKIPHSDRYELGIEFKEIHSSLKDNVIYYVNQHLKK